KQLKFLLVVLVALRATFRLMYWRPNIKSISILCMLFSLAIDTFDRSKMLSRSNIVFYYFAIMYLIYVSLVPYIAGNAIIGNRYLDLFTLFFFYIVYKENADRQKVKTNIYLVTIVIFFSALTYIKTLSEMIHSPYIIRT